MARKMIFMSGSSRSLRQTHSSRQIPDLRVYYIHIPKISPHRWHWAIKSYWYTLFYPPPPQAPPHPDIGNGTPRTSSFTFEFSLHPNTGACDASQYQPNIHPQYPYSHNSLDLASEITYISLVVLPSSNC